MSPGNTAGIGSDHVDFAGRDEAGHHRDAIVRALESGQLAGYAGDVWFPQPPPKDHPWRTMPHHGMTPHVAGTRLVVFAVDHSAYCSRCVEHFRELAPKGLAHLTILNVFSELDMARLHWALPDQLRDMEKVVLDKVRRKTDALAEELKGLAPTLDARTEIGTVSRIFRETLEKTHSEILILDAQGHNWIDRLSLGSVSFQQALEEPYSVLVVRVS